METVIVIPARYKSSRFPGKPLVELLGKPMILWVAELCEKAVKKENIYIATDDLRIAKTVNDAGYLSVMTSTEAMTGTDRLAEVASLVEADIYINVQGDEPLVDPEDIKKVIREKEKLPDKVINAYTKISDDEDPCSTNIPKVIFTESQRMIYMSRSLIPGYKEAKNSPVVYYKQVCIYAFSREELLAFRGYGKKSKLELSEDIEIIRFLEWGQEISMVEAKAGSLAVDVPEDVRKVEEALKRVHYVDN